MSYALGSALMQLCSVHVILAQHKHYISILKELNNLPKVIYLVSDQGAH